MPRGTGALRDQLSHVLWIGGPPDSGKTSVADLLAGRHGLQVYHFDRQELNHLRRADPAHHPTVAALGARLAALDEPTLANELWLANSPTAMAESTIASWSERVGLAIEDLLAMPTTPPIIAEGPGFFPERIAPLLTTPHQAIWLVPTESFKRASAIRRDKPGTRHQTSNPAQAQENLIRRDLLMGDHIRRHLTALNLTMLEIDGTRTLEETAAHVETHVAPWLAAPPK